MFTLDQSVYIFNRISHMRKFSYVTTSEIGSQHLLVFTIANIVHVRGSEKASGESRGVTNVLPSAAEFQSWKRLTIMW